jgi:hypothetical protein
MPYTATELITKFRDVGGEQNTSNPSNTNVLKYLNLARNGDENPFLELLPKLSSEMGSLVSAASVNLTANTSIHALTTVPERITKVFVRWSTGDYYYPVDNFTTQPIYDNSPEAIGASGSKPAIGIANGNLYIFPKPSEAVTAGVLLFQLALPADLASSGSVVESNRVALIVVKKALQIFYRAYKRYEEANYWEAEVQKAIAKAVGTASGKLPENRLAKNRGNLSRFMGYRG